MVDTQYLEEKIRASGKKKTFLAERCGISRYSLAKKLNNKSAFTVDQVSTLCRELGITKLAEKDRIFFA